MPSNDEDFDVPPALLQQRRYVEQAAASAQAKPEGSPVKKAPPKSLKGRAKQAMETALPLPPMKAVQPEQPVDSQRITFDAAEFNLTYQCRAKFNEAVEPGGARSVMILTRSDNPVRFVPKIGRPMRMIVSGESHTVVFEANYYFELGADNMLLLTLVDEQESIQSPTAGLPQPQRRWRGEQPVDRLPPPV